MTRLDRLKFSIPFDTVEFHFTDKEIKSNTKKLYNKDLKHYEEYTTYTVNTDLLGLGFNLLQYNDTGFLIEISGKILKENYYEMINKFNFTKVLESLEIKNKFKIINIDKAIKEMGIKLIDITNNFKLNYSPDKLITALRLQDYKYNVSLLDYSHRDIKNSLVITKHKSTSNDRITIYDKEKELFRGRHRKKTGENITDFFPIKDFENVSRVEGNLKNVKTVRNVFDLNSGFYAYGRNMIIPILDYKGSPLYNYYETMKLKNNLFSDLMTGYRSINHINKSDGIKENYFLGGGDIKKIYSVYAIKLERSLNKYEKLRIRKFINKWEKEQPTLSKVFDILKDFENNLKSC